MRNLIWMVAGSLALLAGPALGVDVAAGDQVVVETSSDQGVPLQESASASSNLLGHLPSGTQVGVVAVESGGWLEIRTHDDKTGFIKKRTVLGVVGRTEDFEPGSVINPSSLEGLPNTASSFTSAKKALYRDVNDRSGKTIYCGCDWEVRSSGTSGTPDLESCGYDGDNERSFLSRATRTEAEHIAPASWFGQNRPCWRSGLCPRRGTRACCEHIDHAFETAHNDLHNLTPAVGQINALRSNKPFALIDGENRDFGTCDFEVDQNVAEVADDIRGDIARVYFYIEATYGFTNSPQDRALLEAWAEADPVDDRERDRNERVKAVQGNGNPFVENPE